MSKLFVVLVLLVAVLVVPPVKTTVSYAEGQAYRFQPVDDTPLMNRTPLILIHGINPDPDIQYSWAGFLKYVAEKPDFHERYKPYFFVFNPADPIADNSVRLTQSLHRFRQTHTPRRPFRIAALSLGGLLVQEAMADGVVRDNTDRVIAISVPFHGTPLANPAWVKAEIKRRSLLSPLRLTSGFAFWLTRKKFPAFERDFCWDNFDGAMPSAFSSGDFKCKPRPVAGQEKYVVYAGFFGADAQSVAWLREGGKASESGTKTRQHQGRVGKHFLFPFVQSCMAGLPRAQPEAQLSEDAEPADSMMAFNDGISPISSQLWLGRFVQSTDSKPLPAQTLWKAIAEIRDRENARLFEGLDHRDWLEGGTRFKHTNRVTDLLHPEHPERSLFEWLEYDLMRD